MSPTENENCAAVLPRKNAPIGIFDSGTGGLTVLEAMLRPEIAAASSLLRVPTAEVPDFSGERFVYLGDQANMPYGDYPGEGKTEFLRGLVLNDVRFLLAHEVKIVVIACNTATAYGYEAVRELLERRGGGVRLVGVVEAGAKTAVETALAAGADGRWSIGVLATDGTVASGVYERALREELRRRGLGDGVEIFSRGCPGLADAVEKGDPWAYEIAGGYLRALLGEQRRRAPQAPLKGVILGCTHFPYVREELERIVPGVAFVDPAAAAAAACHRELAAAELLTRGEGPATIEAYVSVPSNSTPRAYLDGKGWFTRAYKYIRENPDDGSTTVLPLEEALASGALAFPSYLDRLPTLSHRFAAAATRS